VGGNASEWLYKNFNMVPTVAALTILSKLQNDVKNAENQVVTYCHNRLSTTIYIPNSYGAIVSQNSDYFMPGGKIRIQGSVGAYSKGSGTQVLVNGVPAPLNANGVAVLELPVGNTGTHTADITISYLTQDGKTKTETEKVNWTVGAPGAAAVMLDKLDILYIGVVNPITVAAGVGEDRMEGVRVSQGTISKKATGKYEVEGLTTEGDLTITVAADGKTTSFPFRIKMLPPPTAYVGTVKEGFMLAATFRAMKGVRADLAEAPINAPFRVVSYDISAYGGQKLQNLASASNTGGYWEGNAAKIAENVMAGTTVTISKIMVQGPDKKIRPAHNSVILLKII
jgi:gliding motility-associated protein GldM